MKLHTRKQVISSISCGHALPARQRGTTMLVVMILVLVSTLLAMSSFEDSGVTVNIVNNDQHRQVAFRAAEGSADRLITPDNIKALVNAADPTMQSTESLIPHATTSTSLRLEGVGLARGFSIGEGVAGFAPYKFTSTANVTMDGVEANSTVIQGAEQYGPKL